MFGIPAALSFLGTVGRAGMAGYRTLRGIRAARAAQGMPMGYQRAMGTTGAGLGKGTSGTGLQGLMARGAKKFPGATGSTELASGLYLGGEGVGDIVQGVKEGDLGQTAMGIGSLALGTPLASRGLRLAGGQRTLKSKFPETAKAMQTTGKEFTKRIPKGTTAVGLGGITGGLVLGDKAPAEEQVLGEPVAFKVKDVLNAVESDKANIGKVTVIDGQEVIIGSPDYKKIAQQKLDEAYKSEQAQGTTPAISVDENQNVTMPQIVTASTSANITQVSLTDGTVSWDAKAAANAFLLLEENSTISAPSNAVEGAIISIEVAQHASSGPYTLAWNAIFEFVGDVTPTQTATDAKTDIYAFRYNGSKWQNIGISQNLTQS